MAIITNRHNPSFSTFPTNNPRTAWRPFGTPIILVVPHVRDVSGTPLANSRIFNTRIYIENVPTVARVAGHDHVGQRFPDKEIYSENIDSLELADRFINLGDITILRDGVVIDITTAEEGDLIQLTTRTGVTDTLEFYPDADYYDLSDFTIEVETLPSDRYVLVYETEFFTRAITNDGLDEFLCVDASTVGIGQFKFDLNHPGEVVDEFYNLTPPPYLNNATKALDTTVGLYRPFTDIMQDIYDEQILMERVNWVFEVPAEAIPYLSSLLGWELPYFPQSLDALRRAVLRRTVEFQSLKGSRRAIINIFRLFGFEILISNLWWASDGKRFIRPGEELPEPYEAEEIDIVEVCQVDLLFDDFDTTGFGEFSIPLVYRPQEQVGFDFDAVRDGGNITVESYRVTKGSVAYDALMGIASDIQDRPTTYGSDNGCFTDSNGFQNHNTISSVMDGLDVLGFSQILISGKLGDPTVEILTGERPPIIDNTTQFNRETNKLNLTLNGHISDETEAIFAFVIYNRQDILVPTILKDLQSNRFDVQVLTDGLTEFADPTTLDFAIEFLFRLKAFHSLLNVIRLNIDMNESYEVTDWCCLPDTMVTLSDGTSKRIQNIQKGDFVLGSDGMSHQVTKTMSRQVDEEIITLKPIGTGESLKITKEHPILSADYHNVKRNNLKRNRSYKKNVEKADYDWTSSKHLKPDDLAQAPVPKWSIIPSILSNDELEFLGYFAAEGDARAGRYCTTRFSLGETEQSLASRIIQLAMRIGASSASQSFNNRGGLIVYVYGKNLAEFCLKHIPGKAKTKTISQTIMRATKEQILQFYKAYCCGDGSFSGGTAFKMQTTSASRDLTEQLYWLLLRHGIAGTKQYGTRQGGPTNRQKVCFSYRLSLSRNAASLIWPNPDAFKLSMPSLHWISNNCVSMRIKSVGCENYSGLVYNLEVNGTNDYIANGIVVHNCVGGDTQQRYDTDAGTLQVPPAIIPDIPGELNDCTRLDPITLGYKPEDILLRNRKLEVLPEEFEASKALDDRSDIADAAARLAPLVAALGRTSCRFTHHGQDRIKIQDRVESRDTEYGPNPNASQQLVGLSKNTRMSPVDESSGGTFNTTGSETTSNSDSSAYGSFTREFTETRTVLCEKDGSDYCFAGRVDDELLYRPTIFQTEHPRCKPCGLGLGVGIYYIFPAFSTRTVPGTVKPCIPSRTEKIRFSGQAPTENITWYQEGIQGEYLTVDYNKPLSKKNDSWMGHLYRGYDTPQGETLHYWNNNKLPSGDQRFNLALQRPSLEIEKTNLHFPGTRFLTMNALESDFTHPTYKHRPWDDAYSTVCGPVTCAPGPTNLNCTLETNSSGNETMVFDDVVYTIIGNGLLQDIWTLGPSSSTAPGDLHYDKDDVIHSIYSENADSSPYVTLDLLCDYDVTPTYTSLPIDNGIANLSLGRTSDGAVATLPYDPIFSSYNDDCLTETFDFADGYACTRSFIMGTQPEYEPDFAEVLDCLGMPEANSNGGTTPATSRGVYFTLGSGILFENGLRLDCGCMVLGCGVTIPGTDGFQTEDAICSADLYIDQDGDYDFNCDQLEVYRNMTLVEPVGTCSIILDGTISTLLETI